MHNLACNSLGYRDRPIEDESSGDTWRSCFTRDRDRIIFSKCFRRLSHKTQVYLTSMSNPEQNEHVRTRLTHTIEVAGIAQCIAKKLDLNVDLVEAIAFGHDVGHAPFGHAGEDQLDLLINGSHPLPNSIVRRYNPAKLAKAEQEYAIDFPEQEGARDFGDFRHNYQSVRMLYFLHPYESNKSGLNLTYETLEGILRHTKIKARHKNRNCRYPQGTTAIYDTLLNGSIFDPTIEAKVVALADAIAQVCHDLSDAMEMQVLSINECLNLLPVKNALNYGEKIHKKVAFSAVNENDTIRNTQITSVITDYFVRHTCEKIQNILSQKNITLDNAIKKIPQNPVPENDFMYLEKFKDNLLINDYFMNRMDNKGQYIIRQLFEAYISDPRQLPDSSLKTYLLCKASDPNLKKDDAIRKWINDKTKKFGIVKESCLENKDIKSIICLIREDHDGTGFRRFSYDLIKKMVPYLAIDGDFIRTICDYIASMTDVFAEKEFLALYNCKVLTT